MAGIKRTFIISSAIYLSQKKILGGAARSAFTPEVRTTQTIETIRSIRRKVSDAFIILMELGKEKNIASELTALADKYVYVGNRRIVRWAADGRSRGLGEAIGLIVSKDQIHTDADFFFKMSGRYFLTDDFDASQWNGNSFFARKYGNGISTRLYGFHREFFNDWQKALTRSLFQLYLSRSIEDVFPAKFGREKIREIKKIGLAGYVAPNGSYLEE